jgi:hypothetical protein
MTGSEREGNEGGILKCPDVYRDCKMNSARFIMRWLINAHVPVCSFNEDLKNDLR